jgi:hypothetical protein
MDDRSETEMNIISRYADQVIDTLVRSARGYVKGIRACD